MQEYRIRQRYTSLAKVLDDLIFWIDEHSGRWLSIKTLKRDISNRSGREKWHPIPDWRVAAYTQWFREQIGKEQEWLIQWLEHTAYPWPGRRMRNNSFVKPPRPKPICMTLNNV